VETIDEMHPRLSSFTRSTYPQFTETEFKVCLLSYAGLPSKEIALLIDQSVHTVNMARTRIRQKMGLKEVGADFCTHLKQKFTDNSIS
jgi:DNA-binding CsgD family transcriptional regulator